MKEALAIRTEGSASNLAHLDLDNLERFGVYRRLHFEDRSYTNLEEFDRAGSLARLLKEYGVIPGDRVLVMMPNSPELTAAFPAIWTIGASIVPVIPQWTAGEVAEIFRNSGATVVLTVPALAPRLAEAANAAGHLKHLLVFGDAGLPGSVNITPLLTSLAPIRTPVDRSASDLAILLYTSGTTGTPKGVMLTHGNFLAALDGVLKQNPQLGPGPMLHPLPLTHVYGVLMQFLANRWGIASVLVPRFDPERVLEAIERHQIQYMPVVPTMLVYLLNHPGRERYNLSSLTRITSGGAPLPEKLRLDFEQAFQCRIQQGYGLSESASVAASYELEQAYRPGSAGQAVPGVEIRILDDQDRPLPSHGIGEICLAGPNISAGYFRDPDATRQALRDGWLRTGDVGYLDDEGYLFITDRKKDLIIKGGENVSPREIEEALYLHPAVAEAAVVGVPHAVYGEDIWAVVQLKREATAGEEDLRRHVARYVAKFKLPSRVVFTDKLPLNSNGKILKRAVRERLEAGSRLAAMQKSGKTLDNNQAWIYTSSACCNAAIKESVMKPNVKSEHPEAPARTATPVALFSEWVQQGTENFFAAQRILLDLVMRQNAMAMNTLRERLAVDRPVAAVSEFAGEGMSNFIASQKILLTLAERQNEIVMKGLKERVGVATPAAAMTDLLRRGVETFIHLQKHFLNVADKQTGAWVEAAKTGQAFTGKGVADLAREGMEYFAETQKKFLDEVARDTAKATERSKHGDGAEKAERTELTELARQSTEAFIDAQKKLLDTAGQQVDLNLKAVRKTMEYTPLPGKDLADLTRQGVESFVAAQKALLDVMTKPRHTAPHPVEHEHAHVHAN